MDRWITGAKWIVLLLFLLASAAEAAYDIYFVWPARRCESQGDWWDPRDRQCLTPLPIWQLTNRRLTPLDPVATPAQRPAAGTQSTSPPSAAAATRAATNRKSDSRFR